MSGDPGGTRSGDSTSPSRRGDDWERTVDAIHDPIAITDDQGRVLKANRAFRERFGESGSEVDGGHIGGLLFGSNASGHDEIGAPFVTYETDDLRVAGTFLISQQPIELNGGPALVYHLTDLTALRAAEAAARQSEAQARQAQKMEAVGRLGAGVAHDFNNLLTTILCNTELLAARAGDRPDMVDLLEQLRMAAERGSALVARLLHFSRPQPGRTEVLDLNRHLSDSSRLMWRMVGEDIRLDIACEAEAARVRIDPTQLEQILLNLALNARDAMPGGGVLTIRTESAPDFADGQPAVALVVADTGQGMTAEVRARAFEPFFTTKGEGRGTGLGLATVHTIVQQAGGKVAIESKYGAGTEVRVVLPTVAEPAMRIERTLGPRPGAGRGTVLVVEDEEGPRAAVRASLEYLGYQVLDAASGPSALLLAERHKGRIDVLLSDVVMPGMSGPELARALRGRHPETRVVLTSGYTPEGAIGDLDARLLAKPLTLRQLERCLSEVIDESAGPDR